MKTFHGHVCVRACHVIRRTTVMHKMLLSFRTIQVKKQTRWCVEEM